MFWHFGDDKHGHVLKVNMEDVDETEGTVEEFLQSLTQFQVILTLQNTRFFYLVTFPAHWSTT